jgi:single-stranded-DNA-specific exonuclease
MNLKSVTGKYWKLNKADKNKILKLSEEFSLSEILCRLLVIRNIIDKDINSFLEPNLKNQLPNPYIFKDMNVSIDHIYKLIKERLIVGIFGDYDVDGASSTAMLIRFFSKISQPYNFFIPDRQRDGYGPSVATFDKFIKKNIKTIITVDCGTLSNEAVDFANKKNVSTIILDHHQADLSFPKALGIINPTRIDDNSELKYLCATSIVFFFLLALNKKLKDTNWYKVNNIEEPDLFEYLDLVALATICDVVPLVGLNRSLVKHGLKVIHKRKNLGIKILSDISNISSPHNVYHLGYILGPKINAGGRLGHSNFGAKLLSTNDVREADYLSIKLEKLNEKRKKLEKIYMNEIFKEAELQRHSPVLILYNKEFHDGLIGILAARIKDKIYKPTIVLSGLNNVLKGSARSIHGFDMGAAIINAVNKKIIIKGGGHKMAAGFTIYKNNLALLKKFLNFTFIKIMKNKRINNTVYIDAKILPSALNENFFNQIDQLSPFGPGNHDPFFMIENVKVLKSKIIQNKHISSILISNNRKSINTICFNAKNTELESYLCEKKKILNIVGKLSLNNWFGKKQVQFIINDISIN